jgi:hypothetical protein
MISLNKIKKLEKQSFFKSYEKIRKKIDDLKMTTKNISFIYYSVAIFNLILSFLLVYGFSLSGLHFLMVVIFNPILLIIVPQNLAIFLNEKNNLEDLQQYKSDLNDKKLYNYDTVKEVNRLLKKSDDNTKMLLSIDEKYKTIEEIKSYLIIKLIESSNDTELNIIKKQIIEITESYSEKNKIPIYKLIESKLLEKNETSQDILHNIDKISNNVIIHKNKMIRQL